MAQTDKDTIDNCLALRPSFTASISSAPSSDLPEQIFSSDDVPSVDEIVAAILSEEHALSAEQLMAFETLLDAPEMDSDKRQELLQAIWNIVVCLIDDRWKYASTAPINREEACGSIHDVSDQATENDNSHVKWSQSDFGRKPNGTLVQKPRQKGDHDSQ